MADDVDESSTMEAFYRAFAREVVAFENALGEVRSSRKLLDASDGALEKHASMYDVTRRSGEGDEMLKIRSQTAFISRISGATLREIRRQVSMLLDTDRENIGLREPDDETATLETRIHVDVMGGSKATPALLAEQLDDITAGGVEPQPTFVTDPAIVNVDAGSTRIADAYESDTAAVAVGPGDAVHDTAAIGLSSSELGPLSEGSWVLSIQSAPAATVGILAGETIVRTMSTTPTATVGVASGSTSVRAMTRTPTANVGVSPSPVDATNLSTRGLSSSELGPLSSTDMAQLG